MRVVLKMHWIERECVKQIEFLIVEVRVLTKKELVNIEAEDILQSTVFD